jgi:hypothetical protein
MCSNNARETDIDFFKLRTRINYTWLKISDNIETIIN